MTNIRATNKSQSIVLKRTIKNYKLKLWRDFKLWRYELYDLIDKFFKISKRKDYGKI